MSAEPYTRRRVCSSPKNRLRVRNCWSLWPGPAGQRGAVVRAALLREGFLAATFTLRRPGPLGAFPSALSLRRTGCASLLGRGFLPFVPALGGLDFFAAGVGAARLRGASGCGTAGGGSSRGAIHVSAPISSTNVKRASPSSSSQSVALIRPVASAIDRYGDPSRSVESTVRGLPSASTISSFSVVTTPTFTAG